MGNWILGSATKQWKDLSARVERQCAERDEIERVRREEKKARVAKIKAERAAAAAKAEAEAAAKGEVIAEPEVEPHKWSENQPCDDAKAEPGPLDIEAGLVTGANPSEAGSEPSSPGKEVLPGQIAVEPTPPA